VGVAGGGPPGAGGGGAAPWIGHWIYSTDTPRIILNYNLLCGALANSQYVVLSLFHTVSLQFIHTHLAFLVCCPTLVPWYRHPTADVPLPGFPNCPRPTAIETIFSQCTHCMLS
jgi:hypothetical protein